jgi:histidinol-phosphate aminotransferase
LAAEPALLERVADLVRARDRLADGLRELGFAVPDAQGNFVWLPAGPQTTACARAFGAAGLSVRPFAVGDDQDGIRITVGEPEANERVLEVAATLPR